MTRLEKFRRIRGITQRELTDLIGEISTSMVSRLCNGKVEPGLGTAARIIKATAGYVQLEDLIRVVDDAGSRR